MPPPAPGPPRPRSTRPGAAPGRAPALRSRAAGRRPARARRRAALRRLPGGRRPHPARRPAPGRAQGAGRPGPGGPRRGHGDVPAPAPGGWPSAPCTSPRRSRRRSAQDRATSRCVRSRRGRATAAGRSASSSARSPPALRRGPPRELRRPHRPRGDGLPQGGRPGAHRLATPDVFRRLARGQGAFHVRFPRHGQHVEADLPARSSRSCVGAGCSGSTRRRRAPRAPRPSWGTSAST